MTKPVGKVVGFHFIFLNAKAGAAIRPGAPLRRRLAILILATTLLGAGALVQARQPEPQPAVSAADLAQRIHKLVNAERTKRNLPALAWDAKLSTIAVGHSRDMARRNYLSHDSPEGQDFIHRYRAAGYTCKVGVGRIIHTGAENIALGRLYNSVTRINGVAHYDWNSPEAIARKTVEGWMASAGHRENILAPHWKREGIGVEIAADNRVLVTQNFC